jgi:Potential DNA-binding domain
VQLEVPFKVPDGQYLFDDCNSSSTHHSITVSSQPASSDKQQQFENTSQLNHVGTTCENGINNITGIKQQGPLNGKSHSIINRGKVEKHKLGSRKREKRAKCRTNSKKVKRSKMEKFAVVRATMKSHAKSQNVLVEPISLPYGFRCAPEVQSRNHLDLDVSIFYVPPLSPLHHLENETALTRDERIFQRKIQLRRRVEQFKGVQRYRTTERSKFRFRETLKLLKHLDRAKQEMYVDTRAYLARICSRIPFCLRFKRPHKPCLFDECTKEAICKTLHCTDHILLADREQHLIRQCCYLYSLGEQCRVPVHNVMATVAVCNEHQNAVSAH